MTRGCPAGASCWALDDPEPPGPTRHLNGQDVVLRAGALEVRLGCGIHAHRILGWCYSCPGISPRTEALGWRLAAMGAEVPGHEWAMEMSR